MAARGEAFYLHAHEEVGAVLELVAAGGETAAGGLDGGELVGVARGGVELPDLAPHVAVLRAQPRVPPALRHPQPPHPPPPPSPSSPPINQPTKPTASAAAAAPAAARERIDRERGAAHEHEIPPRYNTEERHRLELVVIWILACWVFFLARLGPWGPLFLCGCVVVMWH